MPESPGASSMIGQSSVHALTPEQRTALAEQGATILLLGVPAGTTIGIDFTTYAAGDKFSGLKMIPPGLHFLSHCAASSSDRSEAPIKAGFWFTAKLGATLVRKVRILFHSCALSAQFYSRFALLLAHFRRTFWSEVGRARGGVLPGEPRRRRRAREISARGANFAHFLPTFRSHSAHFSRLASFCSPFAHSLLRFARCFCDRCAGTNSTPALGRTHSTRTPTGAR